MAKKTNYESLSDIYKRYQKMPPGSNTPSIESHSKDLSEAIKNAKNESDVFLKTVHLWYLRFHSYERGKTENKISTERLWEKLPAGIGSNSSFEDLLEAIDKLLRGKYVKEMACYDIALYTGLLNDTKLAPKDYVYIHGRLNKTVKLLGLKSLVKKIEMNGNAYHVISTDTLSIYFGSKINAYELEVLFCDISKAMELTPTTKKPQSCRSNGKSQDGFDTYLQELKDELNRLGIK